MGRGRGRGKKLTVVASHDEQGSSGEEVIPTYRRRGRPQKSLKDESVKDDAGKIEEGGDDVKFKTPDTELKGSKMDTSSQKRKRNSQLKENSDSAVIDDDAALTFSKEETTKYHGFRHIGSRRKNKPHRAAEAGVVCQ